MIAGTSIAVPGVSRSDAGMLIGTAGVVTPAATQFWLASPSPERVWENDGIPKTGPVTNRFWPAIS